jgi:hypothetical protein
MDSVFGRDTPCVRNGGEYGPRVGAQIPLRFFLRKCLIFDLILNSGRDPFFYG